MTAKNSESVEPSPAGARAEGNGVETVAHDPDQVTHQFEYGHGRMPFFMKIVWIGFLSLATWYIVVYLLSALETEVG